MSRSGSRLLALVSATALITALVPAASAAKPTPPPAPTRPKADRAIFFASDGMRPDVMEQFAADGDMPTYKAVMDAGVKGANGLKQAFPPNTGARSYSRSRARPLTSGVPLSSSSVRRSLLSVKATPA